MLEVKNKNGAEVEVSVPAKVEVAAVGETVKEGKVAAVCESVKGRTSLKVDELRDEVEKKNMDIKWFKEIMAGISELSGEERKKIPGILSMVLIGLNRKGIPSYVMNGKLVIGRGRQNFYGGLKTSDSGEVALFQSILDGELKKGTFTLKDVMEAMLYRTSMTSEFIAAKGKENIKTSDYLVILLSKYDIKLEQGETTYEGLKGFVKKMTGKNFDNFLNDLNNKIKDPGDREFIVSAFCDMRFGKGNLSENSIGNFAKIISDKDAETLRKLSNNLTGDQKYALQLNQGNTPEAFMSEFKNNPIGALKKFNTDNWIAGWAGAVIQLLIGLFSGKGDFAGALAGFVLGFGGSAFGPSIAHAMTKDGKDKSEGSSGNGEKQSEKPQETANDIYKNFSQIVKSGAGNLNSDKIDSVFLELTNNAAFKSIPAESLSIFERETEFSNIHDYFKNKFGIELSSENKDYYRHIFSKLKASKVSSIGEPVAGETIGSYLGRNARLTQTHNGATQTIVVEQNRDKLNTETLSYFNIDTNTTKDLQKNLEFLGLDLFKFLGGYKNFIESKLVGLDPSILTKIKEGIKRKVLLINAKIEELKKKEKNMSEFRNNRWIVNGLIQDLFKNFNSQVLPSALALIKNNGDTAKLKKTREMFAAELTSDGDFDKTWTSFEIYDSIVNSWEVFDLDSDSEYLRNNGLNPEDLNLTLLNEKDRETQKKAFIVHIAWLSIVLGNDAAFFAGAPTGVVSVGSAVIGAGFSIGEAIANDDLGITIAKGLGALPEDYIDKDKKNWERALALLGVIPVVGQGFRLAKNSEKVASFLSKLNPEELTFFNNIKSQFAEKFGEMFGSSRQSVSPSGSGGINTVSNVVNTLGKSPKTDKFILGKFKELENGKKIKVGDVEFTKVSGKFEGTIDGKPVSYSLKQVEKYLETVPVGVRNETALEAKKMNLFAKFNGKAGKVDGHEVQIQSDGFKIIDGNGNILGKGSPEYNSFVEKNIDLISKKLTGFTIKEGGSLVRKALIDGFTSKKVKTVWDYLDKAGYYGGKKSEFFGKGSNKLDFLGGIVLTPATTIRQLISAIPNKEFENIFTIIISGNKNLSVIGHSGEKLGHLSRLWNSGLSRSVAIGSASMVGVPGMSGMGIVDLDDKLLHGETDNSTLDEFGDYIFYSYGGIINTLILKALGMND